MYHIAYDVETYPNVFSIAFYGFSDKNVFYESYLDLWGERSRFTQEQYDWFRKMLTNKQYTFLSYNGHEFDDPVVNFIIEYNPTVSEIYDFSSIFFKKFKSDEQFSKIRRFKKKYLHSFDLLQLFNTVDRVSLKALQMSMGLDNVIDLPFKPGKSIPDNPENRETLKAYNLHDSKSTYLVSKKLEKEIKQRKDVSKKYNINVLNDSTSVLGGKLIAKMYQDYTGMDSYTFREGRTFYDILHLADVINPLVKFDNPKLKALFEEFGNTTLIASNGIDLSKKDCNFKKQVTINKGKYTFALGGLHSDNSKEYFRKTKGIIYKYADVKSYYPNMIIGQNIYPEHLGEAFVKVYTIVVDQRMNTTDPIEKYALKIGANGVFGKMGSDKEPYYDRKALYRVTTNGQFFLLMLISNLEDAGFRVFYANTDGVIAIIPESRVLEYETICKNWTTTFSLQLDYGIVEQAMIRDANNYTMYFSESSDGPHYVEKGDYIQNQKFGKLPNAQVASKLVSDWFYKGLDIKENIKNYTNIHDYLLCFKLGKTTNPKINSLSYDDDFTPKIVKTDVQTDLRLLATRTGSKILKQTKNSQVNVVSKYPITIANNLTKFNVKDYDIHMGYYLGRAEKLKFTIQNELLWED